jgi:hypothetical protein
MMGLIVAEEGRGRVEAGSKKRSKKQEKKQEARSKNYTPVQLVFFWIVTSVSEPFWLLASDNR